MDEPIGFRQDVVNAYVDRLSVYLRLMELGDSISSESGATDHLGRWARATETPALTKKEDDAVRLALRGRIARDNRVRGGQKRVESVEVVERERSKLTFAVTYSDQTRVYGYAYREHALRRDNAWDRGDGWPEVPFEMIANAELRWQKSTTTAESPRP